MSDFNYVIREDGVPELLSVDAPFQFLEIDEILENEYPYILDSIKKEDYQLENTVSMFFDEILFENKVVGFVAFDVGENLKVLLTECYILPEFRGNRLFFNTIEKLNFLGSEISISQPNRLIVELLLDYAFAKKVTDNIVVSGIDFYLDNFNVRSHLKKNLVNEDLNISNYYDLSICSTILVEDGEVIYHDQLENDLKKYGRRKELTSEYFNKIKDLFIKNQDEFDELVKELKLELPKNDFGYDEVIGYGDGLSDYMLKMVDDDLLSYEKALNIKNQLKEEYESGNFENDFELNKRLFDLVNLDRPNIVDFNNFRLFLNMFDDDSFEFQLFKTFFNALEDNEELGNAILKYVLSDDEDFDELELGEQLFDFVNSIKDDKSRSIFGFTDDEVDELFNFDSELKAEEFFESYMDVDFFDKMDRDMFFECLCEKQNEKYKLDESVFNDDFPSQKDLDVFTVLNLFKKYGDFNTAQLKADFDMYYEDEIEEFILKNNYVDDSVDYGNWDEFADKYLTVNDIKDLLRKNNLKVSGRKNELIDRVRENNLSLDEFETIDYRYSDKCEGYLKENFWMGFYNFFLIPFDVVDFYKFYKNHDGDIIDIALDYLDAHFDLANKNDDLDVLESCVNVKRLINLVGEEFMSQNTFE